MIYDIIPCIPNMNHPHYMVPTVISAPTKAFWKPLKHSFWRRGNII